MVLRVIPSFRRIFDLVLVVGLYRLYIVTCLLNNVLNVYDAKFPFVMT